MVNIFILTSSTEQTSNNKFLLILKQTHSLIALLFIVVKTPLKYFKYLHSYSDFKFLLLFISSIFTGN